MTIYVHMTINGEFYYLKSILSKLQILTAELKKKKKESAISIVFTLLKRLPDPRRVYFSVYLLSVLGQNKGKKNSS